MIDFQLLKNTISAKDVAEFYGMNITKNNMTNCLFHDDRNPSMKLDSFFYCFGCGESGDCIKLVSKLFDIKPSEAAEKIASDFKISNIEYNPDLDTKNIIEEQNFNRYIQIIEKAIFTYSSLSKNLSRYNGKNEQNMINAANNQISNLSKMKKEFSELSHNEKKEFISTHKAEFKELSDFVELNIRSEPRARKRSAQVVI